MSSQDDTNESQTSSHGSNSRATGGSVTISGGVIMAVVAAFCGMAVVLAAWAVFTARDANVEARMAEYYLLILDSKMVEAGIQKPEDSVAAQSKNARSLKNSNTGE